MKFTDEELSRVLSAHAAGLLGGAPGTKPCLIQVAKLLVTLTVGYSTEDAAAAWWFDGHYGASWSCDEFLAQLEARGLA